jgi:hypothetical protein
MSAPPSRSLDTSIHSNCYPNRQEPSTRCSADPSCAFPAIFGSLCRQHFRSSLCSYSWTGNCAAACAANGENPFTRERAK